MATSAPPLVADIGGTHVRFARLDRAGQLFDRASFRCREFPSPVEAVRAYLAAASPGPAPERAAFAVAGPVEGDQVSLTNNPWSFSLAATRQALGLAELFAGNDFEALALGLPGLAAEDTEIWQQGCAVAGTPLAVLGPGTGLGVGAVVPTPGGWTALATEGGHRDLAATTAREWAVVEKLSQRGPVAAEAVLSGPGLGRLHQALAELAGRVPEPELGAAAVVERAQAGDPLAAEAVALFCGWLGAVAGDLALTLGARGGLFLGGGVIARLGALFHRALFLERFAAKGRFRPYLAAIPVAALRDPEGVTLAGAARWLVSRSAPP
ncbi:MAG: glucokinase [Thermoanaerobaculia bacterium]|nr:glucokinase [Thermoanaerobaculia bacterium]